MSLHHYNVNEDAHYVYGFCYGTATAAFREYRRLFPRIRIPDRRVFSNVHRQLRENGLLTSDHRGHRTSVR